MIFIIKRNMKRNIKFENARLTTILIILTISSLVYAGIMLGVYNNKAEALNTQIMEVINAKDSVITEQATTIRMLSDSLSRE